MSLHNQSLRTGASCCFGDVAHPREVLPVLELHLSRSTRLPCLALHPVCEIGPRGCITHASSLLGLSHVLHCLREPEHTSFLLVTRERHSHLLRTEGVLVTWDFLCSNPESSGPTGISGLPDLQKMTRNTPRAAHRVFL